MSEVLRVIAGDNDESTTAAIKLVLPGSFNPLHAGHLTMARIASKLLSRKCWFELSVVNADKGRIKKSDLDRRLAQDFAPHGLVLTDAAKFVEKCSLFPGAIFVVGADTILRMSDPKYYGNSTDSLLAALAQIESTGNRFLVFGRHVESKFRDSANLELLAELSKLCRFVDRKEFEMNVSSSEIRDKWDNK